MSLRYGLWVAGLVCTLIAAVILVILFAGGDRPSVPELAWVAIALILASREPQ